MPKQTLNALKAGVIAAERHENVPLLFADIAGFTAFSSTRMPKEVVTMLSGFFEKFDKLCETHNVFKVCTIGDCYVVMGFRDKDNELVRNPP
eukprot:CAMPEP_0201284434 /NCGR_PEP_ID=MMETSP1317-20130820/74068_1 /ASSEMBLY_ACC=CAM_ASM_000770 /TAXON_ID=187299 /ORGANISM="Undescribed Undescribed, Strain Undescribed" /LENGTH=91 /DNA_ID=CAMNT_0047604577 /DNA_START=1 /DNA_END=276 /DNA_ORIENTATION=-